MATQSTLVNPLREGLRLPLLTRERLLPPNFAVVGVARRPIGTDPSREQMKSGINEFCRVRPVQEAVWENFAQGIHYHQTEFHDPAGYDSLRELLEQIDRERGTMGNRVFYLATAPSNYAEIARNLQEHGLVQRAAPGAREDEGPWQRIIVEKPFGHDLETAKALND